jgi:hypothetical protein
MDDGYTEHSGCPVISGEKWITTVWMREGVSESNPWNAYDPSGIEILTENQMDLDGDMLSGDKSATAIEGPSETDDGDHEL